MELLWLSEYEVRTPLGDELIAIRTSFLSGPRVRDAFLGYADQQLTRLTNKEASRDGGRWADRRTAKHARHLLRLIEQGLGLYETGVLTIRLADPQRFHDFGEQVTADPETARPVLEDARQRFATTATVLPDKPDEEPAERWLLRVRAFYYRET
jgi:hypothetical protein